MYKKDEFIQIIKSKSSIAIKNYIVSFLKVLGYMDGASSSTTNDEQIRKDEEKSIAYYHSKSEQYLIVSAFLATYIQKSLDSVYFAKKEKIKLSKRMKTGRKKKIEKIMSNESCIKFLLI